MGIGEMQMMCEQKLIDKLFPQSIDKARRHKCVVCKGNQVLWSEREYSWVCHECEEFYSEDYFF